MEKTNHTGKYCRDCKIFTSECDQAARDQIKNTLPLEIKDQLERRMMKDSGSMEVDKCRINHQYATT